MAQKALPYEYEIEESKTGMTCLGEGCRRIWTLQRRGIAEIARQTSKDTVRGSGLDRPTADFGADAVESCRG